jgi:outer membrane protein
VENAFPNRQRLLKVNNSIQGADMKRFMVAAGFALIFAIPALAQEGKIGYVDSQKIFTESTEFQEAQAKFDKEVEDWNTQASNMKDEVDRLTEEYQKNSLVWSATKKKDAEDQLKAKQDTLQNYLDVTFGQGGKAEKRMAELSKPIKDRIIGIIKRIAIENDYDMVLDAANVSIAWAKESLDLTDEVIAELAKEK